MSNPQPKSPVHKKQGNSNGSDGPDEKKEVNINLDTMFCGLVLIIGLAWSLLEGHMNFAYWTSALLFVLAIGNAIIRNYR